MVLDLCRGFYSPLLLRKFLPFVPPPLARGGLRGWVVILRFRKKPKYLYFCHIERLAKYLYFIAYFEILRSLRSLAMTATQILAMIEFPPPLARVGLRGWVNLGRRLIWF